MDQYWRGRSPTFLFAMILLAAAYGWLISVLGLTTGSLLYDGQRYRRCPRCPRARSSRLFLHRRRSRCLSIKV